MTKWIKENDTNPDNWDDAIGYRLSNGRDVAVMRHKNGHLWQIAVGKLTDDNGNRVKPDEYTTVMAISDEAMQALISAYAYYISDKPLT